MRLKNLHLREKEIKHRRERKQIKGERKKQTKQTDQTLHNRQKQWQIVVKSTPAGRRGMERETTSDPFAEKMNAVFIFFHLKLEPISEIHSYGSAF